MIKAALFWSGGKDSALALYEAKKDPEIEITAIVTTLNLEYRRISMHGISEAMLDKQAAQLEIPLIKMWVPNEPGNNAYETALLNTCQQLSRHGVDTLIFGDIFLDDLRQYRESIMEPLGLKCLFPLWKKPSDQLMNLFLSSGFQTITCCISTAFLDKSWLGKQIDENFIQDLPDNVDPCGENGEFHTFCFGGPVFRESIPFQLGEEIYKPLTIRKSDKVEETGFLFVDIY